MTTGQDEDFNPAWFSLLQGDRHTRLRNAFILGAAALTTYRQAKTWTTALVDRHSYTVTVSDRDQVYRPLEVWVLQQLPSDRRRSLKAFTTRVRNYADDFDDVDRIEQRLQLAYDGARVQTVSIGSHRVQVTVTDPDVAYDGEDSANQRRRGKPGQIQLRCRTLAARDAVLAMLQELADELAKEEQDTNRVLVASKWGGWHNVGDMVPRPLESVVLAEGLSEGLVTDLETFLSQEADYRRLGIPWHRGYLLHGPPGTGKTSIAQAVAGHLNIDVYYVPLSDLESDTDLAGMLARVEPRSMLLLEDVDVAHAARDRDDTEKGMSLSGLLNALDGIITPHGLITVMTTNHLEVLDEALVRPGRADVPVKIDYADTDQIKRLVNALLPDQRTLWLPTITPEHRVTPAAVVEAIKPFIGDTDVTRPIAAVTELLKNAREADQPVG